MKIIDLLNKIANGEKVPKKIYYFNREFYLKENIYFGDTLTLMHYIQEEDLNDEVEILEEENKIPEKLETYKEIDDEDYYANILKVSKNGECEIDEATSVIVDKINEIIDYLKSKGDE